MDNDRDVLITNVEYDRLPESHSIIERAESQSVRSLDTETNQLSEEIDPRESQTNSGNNSSSDSKMKLQDLRRKVWTFRTYYAASMWISFCAYVRMPVLCFITVVKNRLLVVRVQLLQYSSPPGMI